MKKYINLFLSLFLIFALLCPTTAFAVGDGNIDGGGGSMDGGTSTNVWSPGNDGVRVTVVRVSDYAVVTTPIDLTNKKHPSTMFHFGKVSKLNYTNGRGLTPQQGTYSYTNPSQTMPRIVSTNGSNNIDTIKSFFTDEQVIRSIANLTGMNYDILIGGDYKLLLEPMAFYKFEGVMIATTATEAAMYDEQVSGLLRKKMAYLTHKNLPLAMFLEIGDLGYPVWGGSISSMASNSNIKSSLGLGIVRFTKQPEPPIVTSYDYEYRVNTEVITAVDISGGQSDPDNPTRVRFNILGKNYNVGNVYYPKGDSQIAWVRWMTPATEQDVQITVSVSGGHAEKSVINCCIIDLDKNPPPNPVADDRNDYFSRTAPPTNIASSQNSWTVWRPWWQEYWVDEGHYSGNGKNRHWVSNWVDRGWWEFSLNSYYARITSDMKIKTDDKNPTAHGRTMKSGYGINETVTAHVITNQSHAVTTMQNAVSYFPEFNYKTYGRLLEPLDSGYYARFEFKKNNYSTFKRRTHFTPIYYPDGEYTVYTWVMDCWSPAGMLSSNHIDSLNIKGSLWDDWHVAPLKP